MSKNSLTAIENLLHTSAWLNQPPGLERISRLLERLDNPQNRLKFVHIAGTNGKGSTAAMTASVLTAASYKTGLSTSPHLVRLNERFQIDGVEISDFQLEILANQVTAVAAIEPPICPTEFELMTAMAFCYFAQEGCDIVVLEVGLGGRLDASNIIPPPEVAVITAIGLDHTAILGDTLPKIAAEKAGILKSGSRCVLYHQSPEIQSVILHICRQANISIQVTEPNQLEILESSLDGQKFSYRNQIYKILLLGQHQVANACVALEIFAQLRDLGWKISQQAIKDGLLSAKWPGRLERISTSPDVLVDGGHNPQCLQALRDSLIALRPNQKFIFLMGILRDKDVDEMLNLVLPLAKQVITITPDSPRALPAQVLAERIAYRDIPVRIAHSPAQGLLLAKSLAKPDDLICAFGSLYTVGELRNLKNI